MTIPDLSSFEVTISIGEEYRGKLQPGCPATITLDAIPGLTIKGELKKISNLARNRVQWDQSSPKVFDGTLSLEKADPRMVSGMTTRVEIVAEVIPNVLQVPIEGVFNDSGVPIVYVKKGQQSDRREVKPGKSNDHFVEILSGLTDGEQIDLIPTREGIQKK
jgi:multidrug efflux pump subunit AcrA (membrane-fusion protein)